MLLTERYKVADGRSGRVVPLCCLVVATAICGAAHGTDGGGRGVADGPLSHLSVVMDCYHQSFDAYTDCGSGGNHFTHRAAMSSLGDAIGVTLDDSCTDQPRSGATCIENTFTTMGNNWGGWYFQNGVLFDDAVQPSENWGDYPDAGYHLSGARHLRFWARGAEGGEEVEFFACGVGRDPVTGQPIAPYPGSSPKISSGYVALNPDWTQYSLDVSGIDLSYVLGGFGWVTNADHNPEGATFYLDDIQYDLARLDELRFLRSYDTGTRNDDFGRAMRNVAFTYDNCVALIAFLAAGQTDRARLLADSLAYASEHDRYFSDGRLRNAYQCGDLICPPGWEPNGRKWTARLPGSDVGSTTGNLAWATIALLSAYGTVGDPAYLATAAALGEWIESNCRVATGYGGYAGGYEGPDSSPVRLAWCSTEHNLDVYVAFQRLADVTGNTVWATRAAHAREFVEAMWDDARGCFLTGTTDTGQINETVIPLDCQTWGILAMPDAAQTYARALQYAEANMQVGDGFDFNDDRDGVWYEGTAQMVLALRAVGRHSDANRYLAALNAIVNADGSVNAASIDGLTTGFGSEYFAVPHIGATAWLVLAAENMNPFWGQRLPQWAEHDLTSTGYYMISFPLIPPSPTPDALLSDDLGDGNYYMWRWEAGGYQTVPTSAPASQTTTLDIEQGFWLLAQAGTIDVEGTAPSGDQTIPLQTGWNMVAAPYEATLDSLQVNNAGDVRSLAEAQTAGWVLATFYGSHDGTGSYQTLSIGQTPPDTLSLWYGYWVLAGLDCSLIVPEPVGGGGTATTASQPPPVGLAWAFDIQATSASSGDTITIAAADTASDEFDGFALDKPKPPGPPGEGRLRMVLRAEGWRGTEPPPYNKAPGGQMPWSSELAMEAKGAAQAAAEWTLAITGGIEGDPVTLRWPQLSRLPKDRVAILTDRDTGTRTFMRTRAQCEFAAPSAGTTRNFSVTVKRVEDGALLISGLTATPTRGGTWDIGFNLSADAAVTARVYNVAGRRVSDIAQSEQLAPGRASVTWNGCSARGTNVPSGIYLLRVTVRTEEGEQASAVTLLQVRR